MDRAYGPSATVMELLIRSSLIVCVWVGYRSGYSDGYGLDGPGIESRWERDFPHLSRPALGPTQPPVKWVPGLYLA